MSSRSLVALAVEPLVGQRAIGVINAVDSVLNVVVVAAGAYGHLDVERVRNFELGVFTRIGGVDRDALYGDHLVEVGVDADIVGIVYVIGKVHAGAVKIDRNLVVACDLLPTDSACGDAAIVLSSNEVFDNDVLCT